MNRKCLQMLSKILHTLNNRNVSRWFLKGYTHMQWKCLQMVSETLHIYMNRKCLQMLSKILHIRWFLKHNTYIWTENVSRCFLKYYLHYLLGIMITAFHNTLWKQLFKRHFHKRISYGLFKRTFQTALKRPFQNNLWNLFMHNKQML